MTAAWAWILNAGRWILTNRAAQIALGVLALLGFHKVRLWQTKQAAVKEEREEAKQAANERKAEHEGDIHAALQAKGNEQQERRDRERDENPRDRFTRDPWE